MILTELPLALTVGDALKIKQSELEVETGLIHTVFFIPYPSFVSLKYFLGSAGIRVTRADLHDFTGEHTGISFEGSHYGIMAFPIPNNSPQILLDR